MQTQIHTNHVPAAVFSLWREVAELGLDTREIITEMLNGSIDFEVNGYRFIHSDDIDQIQQNELENDTYMLGCFNAWFLADILGVNTDTIKKMQVSEAFEGIGQWVIDSGKLPELQQAYASAEGYGHHFSHYDGSEQEVGDYYVFRTN